MERNMAVVGVVAPIAIAAYGASTLSAVGDPQAAAAGITAPDAARFLTQATYGPSDESIAELRAMGYSAWIDQQIAMPASGSHLADLDKRLLTVRAVNSRG